MAGALATTVIIGSLSIPAVSANDRVIVVQPGQTLSQIASAHGVSIDRLVALNHLADPNRIYAGQRLRLHAQAGKSRARAKPITHRIRFGDTLTGIAARYGTTIETLVRRNHIADPSRIFVGQLVRISERRGRAPDRQRRAGATRSREDRLHTVRFGETLSGIAERYRMSLARIIRVNGISNPSLIRAGDVLRIPGPRGGHAPRDRAPRDHATAVRRMPSQMAALARSRSDIRHIIAAEARRQHVPKAFALAVAWQESGWQAGVVSMAGAIGVMQLLPSTADWVSGTMLGEPVNLWNPRSNVRAGVRLLRHYLDRYHRSRPLALAAYYQGQTATDTYGIFPISWPYIGSIMVLQEMFRR
jgi:soluble lytic murein transglycosylase-like protein